ncbi:hypothetical protein GGX14DRAFT_611024 [Mycena pura]|uniref:Uncharacterized protein n=1 Tax=Mycena pura TaxID=153505 RepID=A0AAD6VML3_9AGAR|nr:hypothetical protein GGX14DRAFT_611024 [Mycena pura]
MRSDTLRASHDGRCPHPYPTRAAARRLLSTHKTMLIARRSRRSPPATRTGIGAQRKRPRPAAPTHCAFPPAALHPPCSFPACRGLPTACTLLAFPTGHQPHAHAARCALHAQVVWEPLVVARCTLCAARCTRRPRTTRRARLVQIPPPDAHRPPHAIRCARAHRMCRQASCARRHDRDRCPSGSSLTLRFGHCVHENNMAGAVRWSVRPAMLSTLSTVATAGARDAPVWTLFIAGPKAFACLQHNPRASRLAPHARRPPPTTSWSPLAGRRFGSSPPARRPPSPCPAGSSACLRYPAPAPPRAKLASAWCSLSSSPSATSDASPMLLSAARAHHAMLCARASIGTHSLHAAVSDCRLTSGGSVRDEATTHGF